MKTFELKSFVRTILKITTLSTLSFAISSIAHANMLESAGNEMGAYTLDCAHWYVGGNIGVSHLYDNATRGIFPRSSMNQNGPGWNVNGGYQWNSLVGAELGYTQYYNSRQTSNGFVVAKTDHFSVHLAATGKFPLVYKFNVLGKLGAAYSYANRTIAGVLAASSGSVSPYGALGFTYSVTRKVDFVAQWEGVRGNRYTGSATLYSLGATFAII